MSKSNRLSSNPKQSKRWYLQPFLILLTALLAPSAYAMGWSGIDLTGAPCAGAEQGFGPFDYTNSSHRSKHLNIVEAHHFTKKVEALSSGKSGPIALDIDYTLRAFPNHHRALYAMMRYQLKVSRPSGAQYSPIECYFQRAMTFKPNDFRVMQLYANYLTKKKQPKMAIDVYKRAMTAKNAPPEINYSLGLLYFDLKKFDDAVEQAKIAYDGDVKKSKLARKLKEINRWPIQ